MARTITESDVRTMAEKIAKDYLAGAASLHNGVLKTASAEGLNAEQTLRLGEASNIATYQMMLPDRQDGDVRFDKVDPRAVVQEMNGPRQILEPTPADYHQLPPKKAADISRFHAVPSEILESEEAMEKQAQVGPKYSRDEVEATISKVATIREEFQVKATRLEHDLILEREKFAEIVRQMLLRTCDADEIVKVALSSRPDDRDLLCDLFGHTLSKLGAKGYLPGIKVGQALPPEAISKKLKEYSPKIDVQVINGSHPLLKSVDTISTMEKDLQKSRHGEDIAVQKMTKLKGVLGDIARSRPARVGIANSGANRG